jgi:hypothetical protein
MLAAQLRIVKEQILENDRGMLASTRENRVWPPAKEIPGVGPLLASAIVATFPDPAIIRSGRNLAAWIGLVPGQNSSGGKERLWRDHQGWAPVPASDADRWCHGGGALRRAHGAKRPSLVQLLAPRKTKVAAVALAKENARMIWAMMASGERYREPKVAEGTRRGRPRSGYDPTVIDPRNTTHLVGQQRPKPLQLLLTQPELPHIHAPVVAEPESHPSRPVNPVSGLQPWLQGRLVTNDTQDATLIGKR